MLYQPDDYDPSVETEATIEAIHALNRELMAAGARKFACGLGGFWILEAADIDEALAWARKGAVACRASGEMREILFRPAPTPGSAEQKRSINPGG